MKFVRTGILFVFFCLLLNSCEEDVFIGVGGKESLVVYAILNQRDSVNYIRLERTFSGLSNAFEAAKIKDSICSSPEQFKLMIVKHTLDSLQSDTILPQLIEGFEKLPGVFNREGMLVYGTAEVLSAEFIYELLIHDLKNNRILRSRTSLLGSHNYLFAPSEFRRFTISMYKPESVPDYTGSLSWSMNWERVIYRFYYLEELDGKEELKYINWQPTLEGFKNSQEEDSLQFSEIYLEMLAQNLEVVPGIKRIPVGRDYLLNIYDDAVRYFNIQHTLPDDYLYAEQFSNIENGIGLFASSYYYNFFAQRINSRTMDTLVYGQITKDLGFVYP